ncbi:MAG TPA: hypothetical protein DCR35_21470 [Runella sp.]|nr:hypothetical protein [Runella sp.]HAO51658.1 hypothetical protein [Runella sp.]
MDGQNYNKYRQLGGGFLTTFNEILTFMFFRLSERQKVFYTSLGLPSIYRIFVHFIFNVTVVKC